MSLQEAGRDKNGDNIAQRAIEKNEDYKAVHVGGMNAYTKPGQFIKSGKAAQTSLVIAVKQGVTVTVEKEGQYRDPWSPNKGGTWAILKINGKRVAVISVHLDSNNQELRDAETKALIKAANGAAGPEGLDGMIFMGDLNERLDQESTLEAEAEQFQNDEDAETNRELITSARTNIQKDTGFHGGNKAEVDQDLAGQSRLLKSYSQLKNSSLGKFQKSSTGQLTYGKTEKRTWKQWWKNLASSGLFKSREKGTKVDAGELDRVCAADKWGSRFLNLGKSRTIKPEVGGKAVSDHLGVVTELTLTCKCSSTSS